VFAVFSLLEVFADTVCLLCSVALQRWARDSTSHPLQTPTAPHNAHLEQLLWWFPLYYTCKIGFLVWAQLPATRGAEFLYRRFLRPLLIAHMPAIDALLAHAALAGGAAGAAAGMAAGGAGAGLAMLAEGGMAGAAGGSGGGGGLAMPAAGHAAAGGAAGGGGGGGGAGAAAAAKVD
jgi:hypothetical protein